MAQDDKIKLGLLVEMINALDERVQYLSYFIGFDRTQDQKLKKKIKDIKDKFEDAI
jgi:hypothetical protein